MARARRAQLGAQVRGGRCSRQRRFRGQLPAACACLARATNPGLLKPKYADGD